MDQDEGKCCLFCDNVSVIKAELVELKAEIEKLRNRVESRPTYSQAVTESENRRGHVHPRNDAQVSSLSDESRASEEPRATKEDRAPVIRAETPFRAARKGATLRNRISTVRTPTRNRFEVLDDEVNDGPCFSLVGDSLIRNQDEEFCRKSRKKRSDCYPGAKIENITERVDHIVENSPENTVFVTVVGTNNLRRDHTDDILLKYRTMIRTFAARRKKVFVCGLLPRYDDSADFSLFRKMSGINRELKHLCAEEGSQYFDVWEHFCSDRSLYSRDGLHLNMVGKARFGRVLRDKVAELSKLIAVPDPTQSNPAQNPEGSGQAGLEARAQVGLAADVETPGDASQVTADLTTVNQPSVVTPGVEATTETRDENVAEPGVSTAGDFL